MDIKKKFENSFKGYHKDAPKHLKSESKRLKSKVAGKMSVSSTPVGALAKAEKGEIPAHKHKFFLKNSGSVSMPKYYRECGDCGAKAKTTKYKMES